MRFIDLPAGLTAPDAPTRVLALRDLAVADLSVQRGVAWLFAPCVDLLDVEPAAAAWFSAGAAVAAAAALYEAGRVAEPVHPTLTGTATTPKLADASDALRGRIHILSACGATRRGGPPGTPVVRRVETQLPLRALDDCRDHLFVAPGALRPRVVRAHARAGRPLLRG